MSQVILFGLPPTIEAGRQRELGARLQALLSRAMGRAVEVRTASSYGDLADALAEGKLDYAWLPPLSAHRLWATCGVELLAQAERGGRFFGVIFVRRNSPVVTGSDLDGRVVAYVHRRSASGYLAAAARLAELSVTPAGPPLFLGSHERVAREVESGAADAGATFAHCEGAPDESPLLTSGWTQAAGCAPDAFRVIEWAGPLPADTVAAWPGTTRGGRMLMRDALSELHASEEGTRVLLELFGAVRFAPAEPRLHAFLDSAMALLVRSPRPRI